MSVHIIRNPALIAAHRAGWDAFIVGEPLKFNPYGTRDPEFTDAQSIEMAHHWDFGWISACNATARVYRKEKR
jgi:hypothetical protein